MLAPTHCKTKHSVSWAGTPQKHSQVLWLWHSDINFWFALEINSKLPLHLVSSVVFFFSYSSFFVLWVFSPPACHCRFPEQKIVYVVMYSIISDPEVRCKNRIITEMRVFSGTHILLFSISIQVPFPSCIPSICIDLHFCVYTCIKTVHYEHYV